MPDARESEMEPATWPDEPNGDDQRGLLENRHTHGAALADGGGADEKPKPPKPVAGAPPPLDAHGVQFEEKVKMRETRRSINGTVLPNGATRQTITRTAASAGAQGASDDTGGAMFQQLQAMKDGRAAIDTALAAPYNVADNYKQFGPVQFVAKHGLFENITLAVIAWNAIWIGVDADWNPADTIGQAELRFQLMESFFCIYFTSEVTIRFMAFEKKLDCLKDGWFKFDFTLVFLMVLETWLMPMSLAISGGASSGGGGVGMLSIFRLLRLLRLTRMVRLMRAVPELVTLIKGMAAATRSVFSTLTLLILALYVFAIIFKSMYGDKVDGGIANCDAATQTLGIPEDEFEPEPACMWNSIGKSMMMLFLAGTLLDNITSETVGILDKSPTMAVVFMLYVLISSFTILNMLIGVLCEVVSSVAKDEDEKAMIMDTKMKLEKVVASLKNADTDGDAMQAESTRTVSKREFKDMLKDPDVVESLKAIGVEPKHDLALTSVLFENDDPEEEEAEQEEMRQAIADGFDCTDPDDRSIAFDHFVETIVRLRPSKTASVMDVAELRYRVRADIKKSSDEGKASLDTIVQKQKRMEDSILAMAARVKDLAGRLRAAEGKMEQYGIPLEADVGEPGVGHT